MQQANIGELKNQLSNYLEKVAQGETIEVCKRNVPMARIVPLCDTTPNRTSLGSGKGTLQENADITEPAMINWNMQEDNIF